MGNFVPFLSVSRRGHRSFEWVTSPRAKCIYYIGLTRSRKGVVANKYLRNNWDMWDFIPHPDEVNFHIEPYICSFKLLLPTAQQGPTITSTAVNYYTPNNRPYTEITE